jgi:predicted SAM-dependent methyltransferase
MMKRLIIHVLQKIHLYDFVQFYLIQLRLLKRIVCRTDNRIITRYLSVNLIKKLQVGTGKNFLEGWINSDIDPNSNNKIYLDASKTFPFEESTFNYVFSEHMIEHITYQEGLNMLSECYRILIPGGKIRIATPDLQFLFEIYKSNKSKLQNEYIKWSLKKSNISCVTDFSDTFVINNFFRTWDHKFIYDEKALRYIFAKIGFTNIRKCHLNESDDEQLQGLENKSRMPSGFLELETIVLEGTKPSNG